MAIFLKKEICPVCGRQIRGDVRIRIKDNVELCQTCSSEIAMDASMIPNQSVEDIKVHLAYRKENREKMDQFDMSWGAKVGTYLLRADQDMRLWYFTNDRNDRNPPLFGFDDLKSVTYLEDGEPAEEMKTGLKSLIGEKPAPKLVQSMKIILEVDNPYFHKISAETLAPGTGLTVGTMQYKKQRSDIKNMVDCLESMKDYVKMGAVTSGATPKEELQPDMEQADTSPVQDVSAANEDKTGQGE